jgi:catechol 2,3-dioxygenase-like lactoylglutathione lyase family enzyme
MEQRISVVTLGVDDLERSRRFYEAIGWHSNTPIELEVVFFQAGGMVLALWDREKNAKDSGVELGSGYGGVTLAYNVGTPAEVDETIEDARKAGATISREPGETFWGGYSGVFVDPDGYPWEIAHNPSWRLAEDGSVTLSAS